LSDKTIPQTDNLHDSHDALSIRPFCVCWKTQNAFLRAYMYFNEYWNLITEEGVEQDVRFFDSFAC